MSKSEAEVVSGLIGRIYDAALDSSQWQRVLTELMTVLNGNAAVIRLFDRQTLEPLFSAEIGHDDYYVQAYHAYFHTLDPINACREKLTVGTIFDSHEMMNDADFGETEFYNDFLRRYDVFYGVGANVAEVDDGCLRLGIQRSQRAGLYGAREKRLISQLIPHFQRALKIHYKFSALDRERRFSYEAMDRLSMGVILLDELARPFYINVSASQYIAGNDVLFLSPSGVSVDHPVLNAELQRSIRECLSIAKDENVDRGVRSLRLDNESEFASLKLIVAPLLPNRAAESLGDERPCVALYLFNGVALNGQSCELLSAIYRLTPAESRIAIALANGESLDEAAKSCNIAKATARAHLRAIFEKTDTHRQGELIRLVINSVGAFREYQ